MRYKISTFPVMAAHHVIITAQPDDRPDLRVVVHSLTIPLDDLKVDDLLHLIEAIYREVGQVTP